MPSNPPSVPGPSRLRAENEELRKQVAELGQSDLVTGEYHLHVVKARVAERKAAEATMREVAEELRRAATTAREHPTTEPIAPRLSELADRLDPPHRRSSDAKQST